MQLSPTSEKAVSSTGDSVLARKESDRGTLSHVALPRILQSNLLGSQERRRLATGVRLKVSESLRTQGEIQDDHSPSSDKRITSWVLGRKCRFERRLLPHPHSPQVQTPAPFCHSRERRAPNFPIQSPSVRSDFGAQGIHESDATYRSSGTHTCGLPSAVSRRLDTEKYRQVTTGSANKLVATYHAPGRTGAKCAKVAVSTNPTLDTHRRRVLARCRTNVPADGQGSQDRKRSVSTSIRASPSLGVWARQQMPSPWGDCISDPCSFTCSLIGPQHRKIWRHWYQWNTTYSITIFIGGWTGSTREQECCWTFRRLRRSCLPTRRSRAGEPIQTLSRRAENGLRGRLFSISINWKC